MDKEAFGLLMRMLDDIKDAIGALDTRIRNLECKPASRWEALVTSIIAAIGGLVGGTFLSKLIK